MNFLELFTYLQTSKENNVLNRINSFKVNFPVIETTLLIVNANQLININKSKTLLTFTCLESTIQTL